MNLAARRKPLSSNPEQFKKRLGEAIDLKNQQRYSEAAQILEELRNTHPESASVHGLLGYSLWELNELVRAVQSFRTAVKLSPNSELASLGLFHTLLETGDEEGAFQEMNRFRQGADSAEYEAIAREAAPKPAKVTPKGLQQLEEQIDEVLTMAKRLDREGLNDVIRLLRKARNTVVFKLGK